MGRVESLPARVDLDLPDDPIRGVLENPSALIAREELGAEIVQGLLAGMGLLGFEPERDVPPQSVSPSISLRISTPTIILTDLLGAPLSGQ